MFETHVNWMISQEIGLFLRQIKTLVDCLFVLDEIQYVFLLKSTDNMQKRYDFQKNVTISRKTLRFPEKRYDFQTTKRPFQPEKHTFLTTELFKGSLFFLTNFYKITHICVFNQSSWPKHPSSPSFGSSNSSNSIPAFGPSISNSTVNAMVSDTTSVGSVTPKPIHTEKEVCFSLLCQEKENQIMKMSKKCPTFWIFVSILKKKRWSFPFSLSTLEA